MRHSNEIISLYKRPNSDRILAAPAQATGGIKGIVAGQIL